MEEEKDLIPTPRFGTLSIISKSRDVTYIKQLANTEKKKCTMNSEFQKLEKSKSKKKSTKKEKKNNSSKIKDLSSKLCFKELLNKKFKLRNDFDYEHTVNFLSDKDIALKNIELND